MPCIDLSMAMSAHHRNTSGTSHDKTRIWFLRDSSKLSQGLICIISFIKCWALVEHVRASQRVPLARASYEGRKKDRLSTNTQMKPGLARNGKER